ncbi:MAG: hypothetical protein Q4D16_09025 [Eubacteriales bacterium]|nr:hypothetical protein [Eubacteriales bacterium]
MIKPKRGFWLFIASLIPGAGEMYMGFRKKGISIMLVFWSIFALASGMGMDFLVMFLPIIWFYSFFDVHNLKTLSDEEFYSMEDSYILHMDQLIGDTDNILKKYRSLIAVILIVFGVSILWNNFADILYWILPGFLGDIIRSIFYRLPQIVIAVAIIIAGFYLLSDKRSKLKDNKKDTEQEHYWEPYRPYHQTNEPTQEDPGNSGTNAADDFQYDSGYMNNAPFDDPVPQYPPFPQESETEAPEASQDNSDFPPYPQEELNKDENA